MHAIEYIGPQPKKKSHRPALGGWVILLMAGLFVTYFAWPTFADYVRKAQDTATPDKVDLAIEQLRQSESFGNNLAAAALERTKMEVRYDGAYYQIDYPMGDVPENKGVSSDVIIRSYRELGIDLQELVHLDMDKNFRLYPQLWGQTGTDTNIDHRRVPNLQRFFKRKGQEIPVTKRMEDYEFGDIVVWNLHDGESHIGIVVPGPGSHSGEKWVVHNAGEGTCWENSLFSYTVRGHYRFGH